MRGRSFIPMFMLMSACAVEQPVQEQVDAAPVVQQEPAVTDDHEPSVSWDQVRVQLERAIESGHRGTGLSYGWDDEQAWVKNRYWSFEQRAQMYAYLALGEDGSYSDLVLPSLGQMIYVYREAGLDPKTNDESRLRIARVMVADLLFVLTKLDEQIKSNHDCTERLKTSDVTSSVQAALCPGFYSTQVEVQLEDRDWNAYHMTERDQLTTEAAHLNKDHPTELGLEEFKVVLQKLPERIRPYFE